MINNTNNIANADYSWYQYYYCLCMLPIHPLFIHLSLRLCTFRQASKQWFDLTCSGSALPILSISKSVRFIRARNFICLRGYRERDCTDEGSWCMAGRARYHRRIERGDMRAGPSHLGVIAATARASIPPTGGTRSVQLLCAPLGIACSMSP